MSPIEHLRGHDLKNEVHCWTVTIPSAKSQMEACWSLLNSEELVRAERISQPSKREEFVVGRASLRLLLGIYLDGHPRALVFHRTNFGKLFLDLAQNPGNIRFNLTHSFGRLMIAITQGREVGIDLELDKEFEYLKLAERCFSSRDVVELRQLPEAERRQAFYRCWTRKEAYLKLLGSGWNEAATELELSFSPKQIGAVPLDQRNGPTITILDLEPASGYLGALAVEGSVPAHHFALDHFNFKPLLLTA